MSSIIDPIKMYETGGSVCPVLHVRLVTTVNNNWKLADAVANKRIRIMGWNIQSDGAVIGTFQLKSNSGGTTITTPLSAPASTTGLSDKLPIVNSGYGIETSTGHGLYADVTTAGILFNISFIVYTP